MTDTSGLMSYAPFATWDRDSSSWRTSEATSLWALTLSSLTLPTWGGLRNGDLYERPTPEPPTSGLDCSYLPTPAVNDMGRGRTPEDWDAWTAKMQAAHGNGNGHGKSLEIEAQRLLPTPNTMDGMGTRTPEALARAKESGGCFNLKDVIPRLVGETTDPPSPDGSTSPDDQHPHQLSLDAPGSHG